MTREFNQLPPLPSPNKSHHLNSGIHHLYQDLRGGFGYQLGRIQSPSPPTTTTTTSSQLQRQTSLLPTRISLSWLALLATLLCTILLLLATYYQSLRIADLARQVNELRSFAKSIERESDNEEVYSDVYTSERRRRRSAETGWQQLHFHDGSTKKSARHKKFLHHRRGLSHGSNSGSGSSLMDPAGHSSLLRFASSNLNSVGSSPCMCQGLPGPKGDRGEKGEKGSRPILPSFITELAGPQGMKGEAGEPGPRGDRGPKGDSGKDCCDIEMVMRSKPNLLANLVGPPGDKGDKGDDGIPGKPGDRGPGIDQRQMEDWAFRVKLQVMQGINSSVCIPGPIGPPGQKGDKGDAGLDGKAGPRGEKGDKGLRGRRGFKGDQGAPGLDAPCPIGPDGLPLPSCYAYYPPLGSGPAANGNGASAPLPVPNGNYKTVVVHQGQPAVVQPPPPMGPPPTSPPAVLRLP